MSDARGSTSTLPLALLWFTAVSFVGFGIGFIVAPGYFADLLTGASPTEPSAITDMRATYGGVAFGVGVFVGICARRAEWVRLGLVVSFLVVASIGAARLVGIIVDGSPNGFMIVFLGLEIGAAALMGFTIRRIGAPAG
jgi:hypothetical protein